MLLERRSPRIREHCVFAAAGHAGGLRRNADAPRTRGPHDGVMARTTVATLVLALASRPPPPGGPRRRDRARGRLARLHRGRQRVGGRHDTEPRRHADAHDPTSVAALHAGGFLVASAADHRVYAVAPTGVVDRRGGHRQRHGERRRRTGDARRARSVGAVTALPSGGFVIAEGPPGQGTGATCIRGSAACWPTAPSRRSPAATRPASRGTEARPRPPRSATWSRSPARRTAHCSSSTPGPRSTRTSACAGSHRTESSPPSPEPGSRASRAMAAPRRARTPGAGGSRRARRRRPAHRGHPQPPVRRVLPDGTITTIAGDGGTGPSLDGVAAVATQLDGPSPSRPPPTAGPGSLSARAFVASGSTASSGR